MKKHILSLFLSIEKERFLQQDLIMPYYPLPCTLLASKDGTPMGTPKCVHINLGSEP